ncbi:MAG: acyl-CoA thioesterase [Solirubrobacteraceae bacterium]|nr:acyl-CoA thioesterase [Solirubrobacteraceae bacterium]
MKPFLRQASPLVSGAQSSPFPAQTGSVKSARRTHARAARVGSAAVSDAASLDAPEFSITCDLRWSDFDRLGHLNQAVYHVLIEQARTAWLNHVRPAELQRHEAFVLARVELDYRREVDYHHDQVVATSRLTRIGASSVTSRQEVRWPDGTVAASGIAVMVGWDARERGKRIFGDQERERFLR